MTMMIDKQNPVILASASPRRRELIRLLGIPVRSEAAGGSEQITTTCPWEAVEQLSEQKAREIALANPGQTVIGADTVVACDGRIFGKPGNEQEAYQMLHTLQGKTHQVYTGVTILSISSDGREMRKTFHEETAVEVYPMSDEEIWNYIKTGEPMDKAGAYGIQGSFCLFVRSIRGDYLNVVGLPVANQTDLFRYRRNIGS